MMLLFIRIFCMQTCGQIMVMAFSKAGKVNYNLLSLVNINKFKFS